MEEGVDCSCRGGESSWQNVLNGGGRGTRRISPAPPSPSLTATPSLGDGSERDNTTVEQTTNATTTLLQRLLLLLLFNITCPFFLLFSFCFFLPIVSFCFVYERLLDSACPPGACLTTTATCKQSEPPRPTTRQQCVSVIIVFSLRRYLTRYSAMRTSASSSESHEGHLTATRHPPLAR